MTEHYEKALAAAEKEMAEVRLRLDEMERRQAQLRATIAGLRSLMGDPSDPSDSEDMTLTDAIRTVLKGSNQYMGLAQIMVNLRLMGLQFDSERNASIGATLNRLVRTGEADQGTVENGRVGYKWKRMIPADHPIQRLRYKATAPVTGPTSPLEAKIREQRKRRTLGERIGEKE